MTVPVKSLPGGDKSADITRRFQPLALSPDGANLHLSYEQGTDTLRVHYPLATTFYPSRAGQPPTKRPIAEVLLQASNHFTKVQEGFSADNPLVSPRSDYLEVVDDGQGVIDLTCPVDRPLHQGKEKVKAKLGKFVNRAAKIAGELQKMDHARYGKFVSAADLHDVLSPRKSEREAPTTAKSIPETNGADAPVQVSMF